MVKGKSASHTREVLFEMRKMGTYGVRIAALDPETKIEVSMIGDIRYGTEFLQRIAARKLSYVIRKKLLKNKRFN